MTEAFDLTQCKTIDTDSFELLNKEAWLMEPKIDGWRMQVDVTRDAVQMWTRTRHDASGKMLLVEKHLMEMTGGVHSFRLDGEAVFIDEVGEPDYNFTARCLGSGLDVCQMKQDGGMDLSFFVFDILALDGHDLRAKPLYHRKALLQRYLGSFGAIHLITGDEPTYEQHTKNFEQYREGSVLKLQSSAYAGKRHQSWRKWKEINTIDVRIIGYKEGQGKFEGLIGAIHFEAPQGPSSHEGPTRGFCSGMDDETRIYISDHRQQLLGAVIEINHYGKLVDGFRHPQFKRFRADKS